MKFTAVRLGVVFAAMLVATPAYAGWGHFRGGSSGGGSSGSLGSSGVYAPSYGSSGVASSGGSSGYGSSGYSTSYGSSGASYGSSGVDSAGSSGGSSGRVGLGQRLKAHMAAKRARRAAHGSSGYVPASSGGSSGVVHYASSGGSSGGSSGRVSHYSRSYSSGGSSGYTPAPVSYGSSGGSVGSVYYGASTKSGAAVSALASRVEGDAAHLTVAVPSDAKLYVNGKLTKSKGTVRQFVSRGLKANKEYKFDIRAELAAADGQRMVEEKTVVVTGGQREDLNFAFAGYDNSVETALTLNVPEGAEVRLAGNLTKATGEQRTYRTSRLKAGEIWDGYEVEVRMDGEVKRQSVRLLGGDNLVLSFNFDEDPTKLASK